MCEAHPPASATLAETRLALSAQFALHQAHHTPVPGHSLMDQKQLPSSTCQGQRWQLSSQFLWSQHPAQSLVNGQGLTNVGLMMTDVPRPASHEFYHQPSRCWDCHQREDRRLYSCKGPHFPPSRQLLCRLQLAGALLCSCSLKVAHKGIGTVARIQRVCSEPSTDSHSHYRPLWKTIFL